MTVTVDNGGPIDPTNDWTFGGQLNPQDQTNPPDPDCGTIAGGDPCEESADYRTDVGPVLTAGFQGFIGQTNAFMWGKRHYADGEKAYILAPDGLQVGQQVISSRHADVKPGNAMPLRHMPLGTMIHNIELKIGKGAQLVRSAGTAAQLMAKDGNYAQVRLPSSEVRLVHLNCRATVGQVSNSLHARLTLGKAGRSRWLGRRPHNRGTTMNPVDHPMGGGEGRTAGGRHPCSSWGQLAKGLKTRKNKATDKHIVRRRKKK